MILTLRYLALRYGIYPMLLFVFFFDHIKNCRWLEFLSGKVVSLLLAITLYTIMVIAKPYYDKPPTDLITLIVGLQINLVGTRLRLYVLIAWTYLFAASYHFLRKKFKAHHTLWLSALIFLSCEETWEYAPYLSTMIQANIPATVQMITLYIWRVSPSFLLLFYTHRFVTKVSILLWLSLIASVAISYFALSNYHILLKFDWLLRLSWPLTYFLLAHNISQK